MDATSIIIDSHKITEPAFAADFVKKFIDAAPQNALHRTRIWEPGVWPSRWDYSPKYGTENINKFAKYMTRTTGQLYIKMLEAIDACGDASYHDVYARVLQPRGLKFGYDINLFKSCETNGLMEIDHLGKYKREFFRLTALGKLVLETAKKNDIAYKVLRHFMKIDEGCDFDEKMIKIQLNPETLDDVQPEAFTNMLEAILDKKSSLYETGSYAYWCNKLIECLKKNEGFLELFNCQEVNDWLKAHTDMPTVQRFSDVFKKIIKKFKKNAA